MANDNQLIISVSAETIELVRGFATATNGLEDFAKEGKTTAATITSALSAINKEAKNTFDVTTLGAFNRSTKELRGTLSEIRNIGVGPAIKELGDQSKKARLAVYGLNQVVRDLPFGFIAISNNLPILFDQLGSLKSQTGSVGSAFKAFRTTLFGPAGISIAISAVIGVVTALVQKYGSLGKAVDALIGSTGQLSEEQTNYAKKLGGEIAEVAVLVNAYPNLSKSRTDQEGILKKLNQIAPEYFSNLNTEKTTIDELTKSYDKYIKSFVAKIFIEQQTKQLEQLASSYAQELLKLLEREKAIREERQKTANQTKENIKRQEELLNIKPRGDIVVGVKILVKEPPKTFAQLIDELTGKFNVNTKKLLESQKSFFNAIDFTGVFADVDKNAAEKLAAENKRRLALTEKEIAKEKKLEEDILKFKIQGYKDRINALDLFASDAIKIFQDLEKAEFDLAVIEAGKLFKDDELKAQVKILKKQVFEKSAADYRDYLKEREDYIKGLEKSFNKELDIVNKYIDDTTEAYNKLDPGGVLRRQKEFFKNLDEENKNFADATEKNKVNLRELGAIVGQQLGSGIDVFLDGIKEGKSGADALRDSFKKVGDELKKIIIKLAVIEGIKVLARILDPSGTASKGLGAVLSRGLGVPDLTGLFGAQKSAAPIRGIQIGPGGLALAGQVTFVQRGSDLVGVLAQANNRINRVK